MSEEEFATRRVSFDIRKDTNSKTKVGNDGCCDDEACGDHLANANFFLPPGVRASIRSIRNSFVVREEDDGCCEDGACNDHLANANFFLPQGVSLSSSFKAESSRSTSVTAMSLSVRQSIADAAADLKFSDDEDEEPISRVGRSHFTATGICCSSEIPMVKSIVVPIKGVENVKVSPATKAIYVDHDIDIVSASDLCRELDKGGFSATIIKDAAVEITQKIGIPMDVKVVSVFDVKVEDGNIDALTEEEILSSVISALGVDEEKVVNVSKQGNSIIVEYNPYYVTSSQIGQALDGALENCTTNITSDGGADGRWAFDTMTHGMKDIIELQETSVRWPVIMSGIFCAVSFLR